MALALLQEAQVSGDPCEGTWRNPLFNLEKVMLRRIRRNRQQAGRTQNAERGFTIIQICITLAIISIVSTFAVLGITRARASMRLSASERELAGYIEQARTDSIRRHATAPVNAGDPDLRAKITLPASGGSSYTVTMDFDKDGVLDAARTINLQSNVTFTTNTATIAFDWRGRSSGEISIGLINEKRDTGNINVT